MTPKQPVARRGAGGGNHVTAEQLLSEISDYCRRVGMAESTFGRRAVNDGKLVSRLRIGGRITTDTAQRGRSFIRHNAQLENPRPGPPRSAAGGPHPAAHPAAAAAGS